MGMQVSCPVFRVWRTQFAVTSDKKKSATDYNQKKSLLVYKFNTFVSIIYSKNMFRIFPYTLASTKC